MTMVSAKLPIPTKDEVEHSLKLVDHIKSTLTQNGGQISFTHYIALALYAKSLGYYAAGSHKLGEQGDFVTAPTLSPAFSFCLGKACANILPTLDSPVIFEIGAGNGEMAINILLELERLDSLPEAYWILETSPELKDQQKTCVAQHGPHLAHLIEWIDQPPQQAFNGVVLANELLDALPVSRFKKHQGTVMELGVSFDGKRFIETDYNANNKQLNQAISLIEKNIGPLADGYCSEVNLALKPWLLTITRSLAKGVCLFIDYGYSQKAYYDPSRFTGTLQCYYKHLVHDDPYVYPGLQDITTHVDFTHLAECADALSLKVTGFTSQNAWLTALNIHASLQALIKTGVDAKKAQQGVQKLLSPQHMGERFFVMALTKQYHRPVPGFQKHDLRYRL